MTEEIEEMLSIPQNYGRRISLSVLSNLAITLESAAICFLHIIDPDRNDPGRFWSFFLHVFVCRQTTLYAFIF